MGIYSYFKQENGKKKKLYLVTAEAINKYTGRRQQGKKRGIPSLPKAEKIYKELWNQCRNQKPDDLSVKNWRSLLEKYHSELKLKVRSEQNPTGLSPKVVLTKIGRLKHLKHWEDLHLDLITPNFAHNELDALESNGIASRSLTRHILKEIKCIFTYAVDSGVLKYNPFFNCKNRKLPKKKKLAFTHSEANYFLKEAFQRGHEFYFIWLLALTLGLRRSELAGLKWMDVDFKNRLVHIQRQLIPHEGLVEKTKSSVDRVVAIPSYLVPILKEYKLKAKTDFIIETDCSRWKRGEQAAVTREFCQEIGIKEVTFHQLRATHITLALIDGVPTGIVKANVGHGKLSTTDEYFRSSGIEMQGQTDKLNLIVPQSGSVIDLARNRQ